MGTTKIRPLLIFSAKFPNDPSLDREGVLNVAELLQDVMFSSAGLNIPKTDGCIIIDENTIRLKKRLKDFLKSVNVNEDLPVVIFCGHGFADIRKQRVILSCLDTTSQDYELSGIGHDEIIEMMQRFGIQRYVLILDCCHSGIMNGMSQQDDIRSILKESFEEDKNASGVVYIASTGKYEVTYQMEIENKPYVPFTYLLAKSIEELCKSRVIDGFSIEDLYKKIEHKWPFITGLKWNSSMQQKGSLSTENVFQAIPDCHNTKREKTLNIDAFDILNNTFHQTRLTVLLVKTCIKYPIKYDDFGVPLGLWVLKDNLKYSGLPIDVTIFDERLEKTILRKQGLDDEEIDKALYMKYSNKVKESDVIGISMCTSEVWPAMRKFEIAKKLGKITISGGIFTASNERYLLESGLVDYVIPGIATMPFRNLLSELLRDKRHGKLGRMMQTISGVASANAIESFDMIWKPSTLPSMKRGTWESIINMYGSYLSDFDKKLPRMDIYTSRGCKRACKFCSVQRESNQIIFRRSSECIFNDIDFLCNNGIGYFSVKDEDLLSDKRLIWRILEAIHNRGAYCKIRARYDEILNDGSVTLKRLSELGVREIQYGIESQDALFLRTIHKGVSRSIDEEKLKAFIIDHLNYGIVPNCSFILGIQGETVPYYDELIEFISDIYSNNNTMKVYINFYTPHPYNSKFPTRNYDLFTKNLNLFTHKFPVCCPRGEEDSHSHEIRARMLETYDTIVSISKSELYNPVTGNMPESWRRAFTQNDSPYTDREMSQLEQYKRKDDD